ncbi:M23 family metallopeptidase [bacterium]|nr:M23 family metallopeptidase [bacterium]
MKKYSVIIVPDGSNNPVKLWLPGKWLFISILLLLSFVAANVVFLTWNIFSSFDKAGIKSESNMLRKNLSITRNQVDSLSNKLASISQKNRLLYDLANVPKPEHGYAIGGPQLKDIDSKGSNDYRNIGANIMNYRIDSLLFVARQEIEAMDSVSSVLKKREKILRHTPSIKPMQGFYSSGFGMRHDPITDGWRMHEGIDICAPKGTPVHATADGRVKFAGKRSGFGKVVIINHIWYETRYAHLNEIKVYKGQKVKRGDIIGNCGRTGRATGVHLHYEVRIAGKSVNPRDYILPQSVCVD